jgi:tetratricopeptide (TPR) repeat protein
MVEDALRTNRRVQAEAWTLVIQRDLLRARELLEEGLLAEAMQSVDLADGVADRSLHPEAAHHSIELTRWSVNEHQATALYDRAQEMHSNDDRVGARRVLEQALELVDHGPVAAACRQLLDVMNHPDRPTEVPVEAFSLSPTADEIDYLNHLIATNAFEDALDFLERMRSRIGPRQQEWLDGRIRDIQRTLDYNRYVDEYNRAVDFYNGKQFAEAARVLEKLLATLPDGRESDSVRSLLGEAREAMR